MIKTSTSDSESPVSAARRTTSAVWGALGHLLNCSWRTASWSVVRRITRTSDPLLGYCGEADRSILSAKRRKACSCKTRSSRKVAEMTSVNRKKIARIIATKEAWISATHRVYVRRSWIFPFMENKQMLMYHKSARTDFLSEIDFRYVTHAPRIITAARKLCYGGVVIVIVV